MAGVADTEAHHGLAVLVGGFFQADIHHAVISELQRIVRQLEKCLAHAAGIGGHAWQAGGGGESEAQVFFPGARLEQARHGAGGLDGIAILVFQLFGVVAGQRDDVIQKRLQPAARFQHHFHMIGLLLGQARAFQQLRHAQKCIHGRAQFVGNVGNEGRLGDGGSLGAVARRDGFALFARQAHHQVGVFVAQMQAFVDQPPHALAIGNQHGAEKRHQHGGHGGIKPALDQQQHHQRPQRTDGVRDIGGTESGTRDEFGGGHAQKGQRQVSLCRERAPAEPEHRAQAPGGAGQCRHHREAARPEHGIAVQRAVAIGAGQLFGGDHHHQLQQQRGYGQKPQRVAGQKRGGNAEHGKGKREVMAAQRIEHVNAAGKNLPVFVTGCLDLGPKFGGGRDGH